MSPHLPGSRVENGVVTLTLNVDVSRIVAGLRKVAEAAVKAGLAARRMRQAVYAAEHGGLTNLGPEGWQTDVCAAWLHDSCSAGTLCDCTCHGGSLQ